MATDATWNPAAVRNGEETISIHHQEKKNQMIKMNLALESRIRTGRGARIRKVPWVIGIGCCRMVDTSFLASTMEGERTKAHRRISRVDTIASDATPSKSMSFSGERLEGSFSGCAIRFWFITTAVLNRAIDPRSSKQMSRGYVNKEHFSLFVLVITFFPFHWISLLVPKVPESQTKIKD